MTPERCKRCHQFMPRYGQHRCPCDDWQRRRDHSALHRYATALALALFVGGFGLLYVGTLPETGLPGVESPVPLDPVVAQHGRAPASPEVAGSIPVHGANGGTTPSPAASPMTEPSADGYGSGMPVESMPAPDTATILAGGTTRQGVIAWAEPRFGPGYLAIPQGPGWLVKVCGPADCLTATSTDAGPALYLQRRGRIADVAAAMFTRICGVPLTFGLCPGSITIEGPRVTPPATESEGMP